MQTPTITETQAVSIIIGSLLFLALIIGYILRVKGLVTFGRIKPDCDNCKVPTWPCAEHGVMTSRLESVESNIIDLKRNSENIWKRLDHISGDTAYIRGVLDERKN